jgi:hypothetical protein
MGNAVLLPFALSDHAGESVLYVAEQTSEVASLADWTNGHYGATHGTKCFQRRIDDLIDSGEIPPPHFIKCDVEGAELKVFRGASITLDRPNAPVILFEANPMTAQGFGFGVADAMTFLESLSRARYSFFEVREGGALSHDGAFRLIGSNVLAVPKSKMADFPEIS